MKNQNVPQPKLKFPNIAPEKLTGEYLESKIAVKFLSRYPKWDLPRAEPIMNLIAEKRNLHKTELRLQETKSTVEERRENLQKQWNEIEETVQNFRNRFLEFEEMIIQNEEKRNRCRKKIEEEVAKQTEQSLINDDMAVVTNKLRKIKKKMEEKVQKYKIYEDYLDSVAKESDEFKSAKDVYDKYESFSHARNLVTEKFLKNMVDLENIKTDMVSENIRQTTILMGVMNRVAELQIRYDKAKFSDRKWGEMVRDIQETLRERILDIFKAKKAAYNIYLNMCARKQLNPKLDSGDFEGQLLFIKNSFMKLKKVLENAQQRDYKDLSSVQVEISTIKKSPKV